MGLHKCLFSASVIFLSKYLHRKGDLWRQDVGKEDDNEAMSELLAQMYLLWSTLHLLQLFNSEK